MLPWTLFQYCDDTTGIRAIVKYLFSRSNDALAPPRRQLTTAAAGLCAYAPDFMKNMRSRNAQTEAAGPA